VLLPLEPRDGLPEGEFGAVVYDLDHLALPPRPRQILPSLHSGIAPIWVAVHTYNLDGSQADALRRLGVAVYRELQPELFWFLRLADYLEQHESRQQRPLGQLLAQFLTDRCSEKVPHALEREGVTPAE
jgi:hypothetical protein